MAVPAALLRRLNGGFDDERILWMTVLISIFCVWNTLAADLPQWFGVSKDKTTEIMIVVSPK